MKVTVTPKEKRDMFSVGNIITSCDTTVIVCRDSNSNNDTSRTFSGIVISGKMYPYGHFTSDWLKESFTQFHGTITIEL